MPAKPKTTKQRLIDKIQAHPHFNDLKVRRPLETYANRILKGFMRRLENSTLHAVVNIPSREGSYSRLCRTRAFEDKAIPRVRNLLDNNELLAGIPQNELF